MTNSSRPRELNQVASRVYARQTFSKTSAQSMRNTNDTRNWNSEIGDDLPDRLEGKHASRRLRSNFRFGIFGSIRNPFSRCRRTALGTAFDECGYSVHSLPLLASSSHPRSLRHPSRPILLPVLLECDRDTRARGTNGGATQNEAERTEWRETDFQMDINSSACSTPRSSLITPLQLLSLIKASGPAGA